MIGVTTTVELSSTVIDGDDFDVFLSLRDGNISEDFSSSVGEEVTDGVDRFDLVAVASGEAELPSTEKVSASIGQTACATCVGCPFLSQCVKPQALVMKQESERQENVSDDMNSADEEAIPNLLEMTPKQSYLDRLLAPDDFDSLDENGRGELVLAGYSESTDYQEPIIKKAPEPVVSEAKPIDLTTKTNKSTEKLIPQEREDKTSTNQAVEASGEDVGIEKIGVVSPSVEMKPHIIDSISDAVHNDSKKPAPESLDAPAKTENAPVSVVIDKNTQTVDDNSNSLEHETVYPAASDNKIAAKAVESEPSREAENDESAFTSISEHQHLAAQFDAVGADKSAITVPIDNSGTKAPVYIQSNEINIDATPDYNNSVESTDIVDNERLVDTAIVDEAKVDPPNEQIDVLATDQIFTDTQDSSTKQLDYSDTAVERSHGNDNEFWAEEDAVFFVERQESPVVESEASSAEAVTIALPVETITVREETDDSEPVEQVIISTSPIIEPTLDVESDEVAAKIPEECPVPREECELVPAAEAAELAESELDEQDGLMIGNDTLDDCAYNGEENVANGDDLLMNIHPSSGLWPDDSPLNPENDKTSNDNTTNVVSWLAKLVGAVAVYVACNRRENIVSL